MEKQNSELKVPKRSMSATNSKATSSDSIEGCSKQTSEVLLSNIDLKTVKAQCSLLEDEVLELEATSSADYPPEDDEAVIQKHLKAISTIMDEAEMAYRRITEFRGWYEDDSYESIELALIRLGKRLDAIKPLPTVAIEKNKVKQYLSQLTDMLEEQWADDNQEA